MSLILRCLMHGFNFVFMFRLGEAKASGNLGNTLKVIGKSWKINQIVIDSLNLTPWSEDIKFGLKSLTS